MGKNKLYYKRLDYIRIISCLLVLLYHLNILKGGFLAVCTFFVLSGYLSCVSVLKNDKFSIREYYINRLKKIYLPLIFIVSLTLIVFKITSGFHWMNLKSESSSVLLGYNNYWQLNANLDYFTKNVNSPFIHLWYMAILMQFELVFPILVKGFKKINKIIKKDISTVTVSILAIVSTIFFYIMSQTQDIMPVYYNTFTRIFSIIFGVLLALIHGKYNIKIANSFRKHSSKIFAFYILLLITLCTFVSAENTSYAIFMILTTIISIRLIEYATLRSEKHDGSGKVVKSLSKITYEIYLFQYPVIFFMQGLELSNIIKIPLIVISTCLLSHLVWNLLNERLIEKNKKIARTVTICLTFLIGISIIITEKDYSGEMKELENLLNANAQINETQNNEYLNSNENIEIQDNGNQKDESSEREEENQVTKNENSEVQKEDDVKVQESPEEVAEKVKQIPLICVGDSVLLGVADEMRKTFPNSYIDGKVSRTITGGKEVLQDLKNKEKLGNTVLLALANNGDYSTKKNKDLMEFLGDREVFWVNAVGADDPEFNAKFKEFAKDYPNLHIIDWETASKGHIEYFYADGVHLKGDGIGAYVENVYNTILQEYLHD